MGKFNNLVHQQDIYDEPVNRFVADFIGESNIVEGRMVRDYVVNIYGQDFELSIWVFLKIKSRSRYSTRRYIINQS